MTTAILPERIEWEITAQNVSLSALIGRGEGRGEVRTDRADYTDLCRITFHPDPPHEPDDSDSLIARNEWTESRRKKQLNPKCLLSPALSSASRRRGRKLFK